MKKPTEEHIETFVRNPEQLSAEEAGRIEQSINENRELGRIANWFRSYYQKLDQFLEESKKIVSGNREFVSSFELRPLVKKKGNGNRIFVLAAQTDSVKAPGLIKQVRTFVSEEYGALIRILDIKQRSAIRIDVISDQVAEDDVVIVTVPGMDTRIITRPGGKAEIPSEKLSGADVDRWESCVINLPVLKSKINRESSARDGFIISKTPFGTKSLEILQSGTGVEIHPDAESSPETMVLHETGEQPSVWKVVDGKVTVPKSRIHNRELSVFFFN